MKLNELQGREIVDARPMTAAEVTRAAFGDNYTSGTVLRMSDGRRFFTPGLKSEDFGEFEDAPALPVIPDEA